MHSSHNFGIDVFPWEFMIHLGIVIFTTLQICSMVETTGSYSRNQTNLFHMRFMCDSDECDDNVRILLLILIIIINRNLITMRIFNIEIISFQGTNCASSFKSQSRTTRILIAWTQWSAIISCRRMNSLWGTSLPDTSILGIKIY